MANRIEGEDRLTEAGYFSRSDDSEIQEGYIDELNEQDNFDRRIIYELSGRKCAAQIVENQPLSVLSPSPTKTTRI
jgi:hypothetical protein